MKYAFLRTNLSLAIIGLVLGLAGGFKLSNWQYRRLAGESLRQSVAQAAGQLPAGDGANMTPEQRNQMLNDVKAMIDKAKSNPNDVEAQLDVADQFIQISRPDEAMEFLVQAQKTNPNDSRVLHGLALAHSMKTQFPEAINAAKRSLELEPKNPRLEMLLFTIYLESKTNLAEAERLLSRVEASGSLTPQIITR
ncbi:MAG: tetratricopeptide repeat protein, partial [Acidobacteria bacterium]|nr:tetratricopeptide repeat protein [Acidobacteriota bacterium]